MSSQVSLNYIGSQIVSNDTNTSNYILNTSNFLQQNINTKQSTITGGGISSIITNNLASGIVLISDGSGKVSTHGTVTSNQLTFLDGVTSSIQTQINDKEPSFTVLGLSKGGIGTSSISSNTLLGATTSNTISGLSLGTFLNITNSTLNVSSTSILSLANNYIDLNITNNSYSILKETFDNTIVKYNNNFNITNNSNYLIKNIINFNNNYTLHQSDYIHNISYNNIVEVVCSTTNTVFLENTGKVLACGQNGTINGITGTRHTNGVIYVPEYVLGTSGLGTQMTGIINVICSTHHTVYLENTGKVLACGYNGNGPGMTGTRTTNGVVFVPEYVLGTNGIGTQITGIINVICSSDHTVFLENTGKVLACGNNGVGGDGATGYTGTRNEPSRVYVPEYVLATDGTSQMTGIVNMVCSVAHTEFLENTGKVLAIGFNVAGSNLICGITGTGGVSRVYVPRYVLAAGGSNQMTGIINIACSQYNTVFLENTGKVLACGFNNTITANGYGITGTLTTSGTLSVSQYVLGTNGTGQMTGIVNIACSQYNTVFLENTGKVLSCGFNSAGGITGTLTTSGIEYVPKYVLGTGGTGTQMTGIVNIACSNANTVFLENTGKVLACGYNNGASSTFGITGTATTLGIVYTPQYVLGIGGTGTQMTGIANMVCSNNHTVFLENTGRALACGFNSTTLGITGTLATSGTVYVPQYVIYTQNMLKNYLNIDTTYYNNIQKIVCSYVSTVFLENTGKVLACGANAGSAGITGTRTTNGIEYVAQYVLGTNGTSTQMISIVNIVCSQNHTVYLENTGRVLSCGWNNSGGNSYGGITGTRVTNGIVFVPQYVLATNETSQMTGIINIACSTLHTVFLEKTGKVLACGYNYNDNNSIRFGITGTRTTFGIEYVPKYVLGTNGSGQMTGIINIVCSDRHTVFLENTGKVLANGWNNNNNVGGSGNGITGTRVTNGIEYTAQYVLGINGSGQMTGIVNMVCSQYHTVYLENTGKVLACGYNTYGVGITGTRITSGTIVYIPEYVLGTQMTGIINIVCSRYNTVFLENTGKVLACGYNSLYGFGTTGTRSTNGEVYVPEYVLGTNGTSQMTGIVNMICSPFHTVYLEKTGKVLACGANNFEDIAGGITGTITSNTSVIYVPQYVLGTNGSGQMTGIINIACSDLHTVYLENTGKTLACGLNNNYGEGITGTLATDGVVYAPQYVIYTQNLFKNYIINAINGNNCIFAITDTNNVIANYDNTYGKLGTAYPIYNYNDFVTNYTGSGNLSGVAKIACGLYHTVFLLNTNTAYSCGFNIYGQLGTNNNITYTIPTAITNGTFVSNIACGLYHTILLSGTTAKSCGLNNYGQLGLNDNNNRSIISDITSLTNISDIDCGEYFTVLKVEKTIYSTGLNDKGQLGVGNTTNRIVPTQVLAINNTGGTITNVNLIKCTKNNIIFLLFDNTIAVSGNNVNNIYNDPTVAYYTFPSLIKLISVTKTNISAIYTNIYTDEIYIKTS